MTVKLAQNPADEPGTAIPAYGCGGCALRWGGSRTAHCAADGCHQTFTGLSTFNKHRSRGKCMLPLRAGLVDAGRSYSCWGSPDENDRFPRAVVPTRAKFIAQLTELADAAKEIPFVDEAYVDHLIATQTLGYDLMIRGSRGLR